MAAWTKEMKQRLVEMRRGGATVPVIADALGQPVSSTYAMAAKLCKIQEKAPLDDDAVSVVTSLFNDGYSAEEIAIRSGRSEGSIRWALAQLDLRRGREIVWTDADLAAVAAVAERGGDIDDAMKLFPGRLRSSVASRLAAAKAALSAADGEETGTRYDAALVEAVRDNFTDRRAGDAGVEVDHVLIARTAEEIAETFDVSTAIVRRIADMVGRSFAPRWTPEQHAFLLDALTRFEKPADVARFVGPRVGKPEEAVRSRIKALRLEATGTEGYERPERTRRAMPVRAPVRPVRAQAAAPVVRRVIPARRPARVTPAVPDDIDDMVARFLARREVTRVVDDREDEMVRALRRRGYVVTGNADDGFSVDGKAIVDIDALEAFARARRVGVPDRKEVA